LMTTLFPYTTLFRSKDTKDHEGKSAEVLAGETIAAREHLQIGDRVHLTGEAAPVEAVIVGILSADPDTNNHFVAPLAVAQQLAGDRKSTRLNSSHVA